MRALLLAAFILAPAASAASSWSVAMDAPPVAGAGLPFLVRVCGEGSGALEVKASLTTSGRYVAAGADGCADIEVQPPDEEGAFTLTARVRPAGGDAKATTSAQVRLARADVLVVSAEGGAQVGALRVPARGGVALVPRLSDAQPPAPRLVIESAWGAPFSGIVLRNDGPGDARLLGLALSGAPLPDATLAPRERLFLGVRAPPSFEHAPFAKPKAGALALLAAKHELDRFDVPALSAGEVADAAGARRAGRTSVAPAWIAGAGELGAWTTPDAGAAPVVRFVDAARDELLVEAYEIRSVDVAAALGRALDRGVRVRMLLEGAPVGGVRAEEQAIVAALVARGANVSFLRSADGFPARYQTLHAKLMVADGERVLVSTDNFVDASYPAVPDGSGTRGYGIALASPALARALAPALASDFAPWPDVQAADGLPPPATLAASAGASTGPSFSWTGPWRVAPALSPDASSAVLGLLANASDRIDVAMLFAQPRFGDGENPFLDALVAAARRNVSVRLLLDGHVDEGGNAAVAERLNALAAREALPLVARVDDAPRTLHAKLVMVDEARAYVGSMNWGRASMMENREAGLLVEAPPFVAFWGDAFERDWREEEPPRRDAPAGGSIALFALAISVALRRARAPCRRRRA